MVLSACVTQSDSVLVMYLLPHDYHLIITKRKNSVNKTGVPTMQSYPLIPDAVKQFAVNRDAAG